MNSIIDLGGDGHRPPSGSRRQALAVLAYHRRVTTATRTVHHLAQVHYRTARWLVAVGYARHGHDGTIEVLPAGRQRAHEESLTAA